MITRITGQYLHTLIMVFGAAQKIRPLPSFHKTQGKSIVSQAGIENHRQRQLVPHGGIPVFQIGKCRGGIVHRARHISCKGNGTVMEGIGQITPLVMFHTHNAFRRHEVRPGPPLTHGLHGTMEVNHQLVLNHQVRKHIVLPHGMLGIILEKVNL